MTTTAAIGDHLGLLDKERIIAPTDYNRWLVPPAALAIHLCIGMAYGFSVFWKPLQGALLGADGKAVPECSAAATTFGEKAAGTLQALFTTSCNWSQFDLGWMYTLFFVLLGTSAALWGGWLERVGPRRAGVVAAFCWSGRGDLLLSTCHNNAGAWHPARYEAFTAATALSSIALGFDQGGRWGCERNA
jgi:MFS family permease